MIIQRPDGWEMAGPPAWLHPVQPPQISPPRLMGASTWTTHCLQPPSTPARCPGLTRPVTHTHLKCARDDGAGRLGYASRAADR